MKTRNYSKIKIKVDFKNNLRKVNSIYKKIISIYIIYNKYILLGKNEKTYTGYRF